MPLPSGIVTFVFTDIEGSTQLFRRLGDRYPPLLERHHQLLRDAWRAHNGCEVEREGDAFFVAFANARDAVVACAQAQRSLAVESWPLDAVVRVRMGIHAGLAYPRDQGYIAFAVHQTARVVGAANGGQIVVTADAARRASIVPDVELMALGRYRVRDFDEPVELFTVRAAGLPAIETPLRALPADRHNLVRPMTALLGRTDDLAALAQLIQGHRLVSVVGTGGLGKTRLVIEYGLAHAEEWQHGVWFVDLGRVGDTGGVVAVIAEAVSAPIGRESEVWPAVVDHLRERQCVLLVDNCEHLGVDIAAQVDTLLRACPGVRVAATSREPLGLRGERVWRPGALSPRTTAVELFCLRAGLDHLSPDTLATVVELCERLDGLPLAIELAAARADVVTPAQMLARLDGGRGLGASRDPTLEPRQRSLEDLIGWSYDLLTADEQAAFRRLALFVAGFDLESATAAVATDALDAYDVPDLVWSLLSKSLIVNDPGAGATRYRMLSTIRDHARRLLEHYHESTEVAARLARYYMDTFGPQIDKKDTSFHSGRSREVNNLRHLIPILAGYDVAIAQALATVVVDDAYLPSPRRALSTGQGFLDELDEPTPERVGLLARVASCAANCGDLVVAGHLIEQALALRATVGEPGWLDGVIDQHRGIIAIQSKDPSVALEIAAQGLTSTTTLRGQLRLYNVMAIASSELDDPNAARRAAEHAVGLSRRLGNISTLAQDLANLAEMCFRAGDLKDAAAYQLQALDLAMDVDDKVLVAFSIIVAARIIGQRKKWILAARLQTAADTLLADAGVVLYPADRALNDSLLAEAATHLGPEAFERQRSIGASLPIEDAIIATREVLAAADSADE